MSTLLTFEGASLPVDCGYEVPTLVLFEVSAVSVVVVTMGVGVGLGVGVGVGAGVGEGVGDGVGEVEGVNELDPLLLAVVVVDGEVKLFEAAPPQPITSANPSKAHNKVLSREI